MLVFSKMGYPPNHPFQMELSIINQPFGGYPQPLVNFVPLETMNLGVQNGEDPGGLQSLPPRLSGGAGARSGILAPGLVQDTTH